MKYTFAKIFHIATSSQRDFCSVFHTSSLGGLSYKKRRKKGVGGGVGSGRKQKERALSRAPRVHPMKNKRFPIPRTGGSYIMLGDSFVQVRCPSQMHACT